MIKSIGLQLLIIGVVTLSSCEKDTVDETFPTVDYTNYNFEEPEFSGTVFYVDPESGSMDGDGSAENPWSTLQELIEGGLIQVYKHSELGNVDSELELINEDAPVQGGDKIILKSGYHGYIDQRNFMLKDWLTIEGDDTGEAVFSMIKFNGAFKNIYFKNITVRKDSYQGEGNYWDSEVINYNTTACIYLGTNSFYGQGSNVKINNVKVKTVDDASAWTADEWLLMAAGGISLRTVKDIEIVNCEVENISLGIAIEYFSDNTKVVNTAIRNYRVDGARIVSNNVLFENNIITGCIDVDENHDDAIQAYSRGEDNSSGTGTLYNCVIRGNLIIGITDLDHPLAGNPQGIGCFDGFFDGWTIENNVIVTNHYHGISFYGMRNSIIANNTVVDQTSGDDLSPWIQVNNHKNGEESSNCLIASNIVMRSISMEGSNQEEENNYIIGLDEYAQLSEIFVNPEAFDFNLLINDITTENIIDKGAVIDGMQSSEIDKAGNLRTDLPDLGAYEAQ